MRQSNSRGRGLAMGITFATIVPLALACGGGSEPPTDDSAGRSRETLAAVASLTMASFEQPAVPTDACGLVSEEEVSGILGKTVVSQELMPLFCEYVSEESGTGGAEVLLVDATALGCALAFDVGGLQGARQVDGLGAEARFKDGEAPELAVCFDEAVMLKVVIRAETTDSLAMATEIARVAEARIR